MDFHELTDMWKDTDHSIDKQVQLNQRLIKELGVKKIHSSLGEIKWSAWFELIVGVVWMGFLLEFSWQHLGEMKFLATSLVLLLINLFSMVLRIQQLGLMFNLNAHTSLLKMQQQLERLEFLERAEIKSLLVLIPAFAAPFFVVMAKAWLGLDLYAMFPTLLWNYTLGSFVVAVILVVLLLAFPNKGIRDSKEFLKDLQEE